MNQSLWLEARKKGVGGSDVGSILGFNKYKSPLQLYYEKINSDVSNVDNAFTRAGTYLEPAIANWYRDTGEHIVLNEGSKIYYIEDTPYLCTPDRILCNTNGSVVGVLECKNTSMTFDEIPLYWYSQLQWNMSIVGVETGVLAWLEKGYDFKAITLDLDQEFINESRKMVDEFWYNHVQKQVPPDPLFASDAELAFPKYVTGKTKVATPEIMETCFAIKKVQEEIKQLTEENDKRKDTLKLFFGDAAEIVSEDGISLATWKNTKDIDRFNQSAFKADEPELYAQYSTSSPGYRRLLVKCVGRR